MNFGAWDNVFLASFSDSTYYGFEPVSCARNLIFVKEISMGPFILVDCVGDAKDQLLRLRKTTSERREPTGNIVYMVDGNDYSATELIQLANSVVGKAIPRLSLG
jgi:hypothetical protein